MNISPGALHTELFIFIGGLKALSNACVDPSKPIEVTDEVRSCAADVLQRWPKEIAPMLEELLKSDGNKEVGGMAGYRDKDGVWHSLG